jgi:hypothetical protein
MNDKVDDKRRKKVHGKDEGRGRKHIHYDPHINNTFIFDLPFLFL